MAKLVRRRAAPMGSPTNADRAGWADLALGVFQTRTGTDDEDAVADLVCDLCHWATAHGQDALAEVSRGLRNYADERDYPPDGWPPDDKLARVEIILTRGS